MKRSRWIIALLFVLSAHLAHADSITTFSLTRFSYDFFPASGGDNAGWGLSGFDQNLYGGIYLYGGGSALCARFLCSADAPFSPGTSFVPDVSVDLESAHGYVVIGGHTYRGGNIHFRASSIVGLVGFTFPPGGNARSTFTVTVPAVFGPVHGLINGTPFDVDVDIPPGKLVLTFNYFPASNENPASYVFSKGHYKASDLLPIPEPGTIGFMATGLAGIAGLIRRKRDWRRTPKAVREIGG